MSTKKSDLEVGEIVYEPYATTRYGKIIDVREALRVGLPPIVEYRVRWKNGDESWHPYYRVNSLDELIRQTERKLENHRKRHAKAVLL